MKLITVVKIVSTAFLLTFSFQAHAWKCGQRCPSNIFEGRLECEAYQVGCKAEDVVSPIHNKMIVNMRNNYPLQVRFKFFSQDGSGYWGPYTVNHTMQASLSCTPDEKICYGAWSGDNYWGVGKDGTANCDNCCGNCGGVYDFGIK